MTQRLLARIVAVLVLVASVYTGALGGAWYCEGRVCGVTLWNCCCVAPDASQDGNCQKTAGVSTPTSGSTNLCQSGCQCVRVLSSATDGDRAARQSSVAPTPVLLAIAPTPPVGYVPPSLSAVVTYPVDTRGPPPGGSRYAAPNLRAPPVA